MTMHVAFFPTCVNDALQPTTAIVTVTILERLGIEVGFPFEQTRCGQPPTRPATGVRPADVRSS